MGSNMPNVRIEFYRDGSNPVIKESLHPRQDSKLLVYFNNKGDFSKPFEFHFKVGPDLKKMFVRFYNPFDSQWFEQWIDRT